VEAKSLLYIKSTHYLKMMALLEFGHML